jgi:hypothetical protein
MPDDATALIVAPAQPMLSPIQIAFLESLVPGPKAAWRCQDATTVGSLIRLNLVAWQEGPPAYRRRNKSISFRLTQSAMHFLADRTIDPGDTVPALR